MNGIVVIPVHTRPEFLQVTLDFVEKADHADQYHYLFQCDAGFSVENIGIIDKFSLPHTTNTCFHKRTVGGNTENILRGLLVALLYTVEHPEYIVHVLEEDIWVGRDYFTFHEAMHKQFAPEAVSACANQFLSVRPPNEPSSVYASRDYQSLGVSFKDKLLQRILVHARPSYWDKPHQYLNTLFPDSKFGHLFVEQDGLISRIIEDKNYKVIYPYTPRAYHAGYYSYHRIGEPPIGTLEEKINHLRNMTDTEMNNRSQYKDIKSCFLGGYDVTEFTLKEFLPWTTSGLQESFSTS